MGNWVRCTEMEESVDKRDSAKLRINLDHVFYMTEIIGGGTALFLVGDKDTASMSVHETPDELLAQTL